jgi:hypothetical protein
MAGVLVPYDRFLEIRERRYRVAAAMEAQSIEQRPAGDDRPPDGKAADPRVRVEGGLITTHD